eukprot:1145176-Pelagomonas_calceolata.AAC.8
MVATDENNAGSASCGKCSGPAWGLHVHSLHPAAHTSVALCPLLPLRGKQAFAPAPMHCRGMGWNCEGHAVCAGGWATPAGSPAWQQGGITWSPVRRQECVCMHVIYWGEIARCCVSVFGHAQCCAFIPCIAPGHNTEV